MTKLLRYSLMVFLMAMLFACGNKNGVKLPDMSRNYSKRSKKPFGTYTAYQLLKSKYKKNEITTLTKDFYNSWVNHISGIQSLYVVVSKKLLLSERDLKTMLQFVDNGNQLFISSEYIDQTLLDTLGVQVQYYSEKSLFQPQNPTVGPMHYTTVAMADSVVHHPHQYGYFFFPFDANFVNTDSIGANTLGLNETGDPNYISVIYGKGRIFLHLHPEAMSNYFLLRKENHQYFEQVFSYAAPERYAVYWDDYYRIGQEPNGSFSSFTVFLKYPMLKWALFIAIALMLLYIAFGSKRRQRPVPVLVPNTNDSISFVQTIGRLYLQKKDNHNIAHKMITYFMEYIRTHYYLNTSQLNAEFFSSLARKSGVEETAVKEFFQMISQLQESAEINDHQLLELNNRIQLFLKS